MIPQAYRQHYAVGAFNVTNIETTQAVISAAEELKSPVIVQTSEKALDYAGFDNLVGIVLGMAKKSTVPVVVHLDHGRSVDIAKKCLTAGYSSVMIDLNKLPFADNLSRTIEIVKIAKQYGASVEAELGGIMGREDYVKNSAPRLTDVGEAVQFVQRSGATVLAVGIGNAHGVPMANEKLHFDILEKIQKATNFPLVLHGASSTAASEITKAIRLGVVKINIDTDIRLAFSTALRKFMHANPDIYDTREIIGAGREAIYHVVAKKISIFNSIGKA